MGEYPLIGSDMDSSHPRSSDVALSIAHHSLKGTPANEQVELGV